MQLAVSHSGAANALLASYDLPSKAVVLEELDGELRSLEGPKQPMCAADGADALGFWSSSKALTNGEAIDVGIPKG